MSYDDFKSKSPCFLLKKNINFNKTETESKMEKLKIKLWWVGAREWKKSAFFVMLILSESKFFSICVLPQCTK